MPRRSKLVMVTNDDSVQSEGLMALARAVSKFAEVVVVAPEQPQSATALSLTFHKPLRVAVVKKEGFECHAVSGSPGDCVMIGVNKILPRRPDLVISGINIGGNTTFQDILASGTVAAALESAISGIPSVAFSLEAREESLFTLGSGQPNFEAAAKIAGEIVRDVLEHGMPGGAEALNVDFPEDVDESTKIALTEVGRRKYTDKVIVRKDPRGRPYYWLFGEKLSEFPPRTDVKAVLVEKSVSVTPLVLNMSGPITEGLEDLRKRVEGHLREAGRKSRRKGKGSGRA